MSEPWPIRAARVLPSHGSSFPEYYLLCTAGYRVNLERMKFIEHAASQFQGLGWPGVTAEELNSAFDRLVELGLMTVLTELEFQVERERRAASPLPELNDAVDYRPGHVDFAEPGYRLCRTLVREICGEDQVEDAGFNLDSEAKRFDVYAVTANGCTTLMDTIQEDGDAYTGAEGTRFVDREEPTDIGAWRPNRFSCHASGYHGVLWYVTGAPQPAVAADGASRRR
jgi:hypothetical protein